jgi:hypothetical protein
VARGEDRKADGTGHQVAVAVYLGQHLTLITDGLRLCIRSGSGSVRVATGYRVPVLVERRRSLRSEPASRPSYDQTGEHHPLTLAGPRLGDQLYRNMAPTGEDLRALFPHGLL